MLVPTPLKDLKNQKAFFKVICKRDKELESLSKKHEKVGPVLSVLQSELLAEPVSVWIFCAALKIMSTDTSEDLVIEVHVIQYQEASCPSIFL